MRPIQTPGSDGRGWGDEQKVEERRWDARRGKGGREKVREGGRRERSEKIGGKEEVFECVLTGFPTDLKRKMPLWATRKTHQQLLC